MCQMKLISRLKQTKFASLIKKTFSYEVYKKDHIRAGRRIRAVRLSGNESLTAKKKLVMDKVDVVITTKCNLLCDGCSHLMPYYKNPNHLDRDRMIASMHKLSEAADWFDHFNILGGEPFLNPDLKYIIEEIPTEKSRLVQVLTNATIIPTDPKLFDAMRRKGVHIVITPYPSNEKTREQLISKLESERVAWNYYYPEWTDYGEPRDYCQNQRGLRRQFIRCDEICKNLFDGKLYYCHRCAHIYDLGFCQCGKGEAVDLLNNTTAQNRRQIRRLMHRLKPFRACRYCLKGTNLNVSISRGK